MASIPILNIQYNGSSHNESIEDMVNRLSSTICTLEKQLQENAIAMEKANEYLQLANEENETLIKALEKIANQTETEILFTQVGSARQIAIAALKKDQ